MANITTFLDNTTPQVSKALSVITKKAALVNGSAAQNDYIQLFTVPTGVNFRLTSAHLKNDASLGGPGAVATLYVNRGGTRTQLTGATTSGAASSIGSSGQAGVPFDLSGGDIIEAQITGAGITASANLSADLVVARQ